MEPILLRRQPLTCLCVICLALEAADELAVLPFRNLGELFWCATSSAFTSPILSKNQLIEQMTYLYYILLILIMLICIITLLFSREWEFVLISTIIFFISLYVCIRFSTKINKKHRILHSVAVILFFFICFFLLMRADPDDDFGIFWARVLWLPFGSILILSSFVITFNKKTSLVLIKKRGEDYQISILLL